MCGVPTQISPHTKNCKLKNKIPGNSCLIYFVWFHTT